MTDQFPDSRDSVTEIEGSTEVVKSAWVPKQNKRPPLPACGRRECRRTYPVIMVGPNARISPTQLRIEVSVKVLTVPYPIGTCSTNYHIQRFVLLTYYIPLWDAKGRKGSRGYVRRRRGP